MYLPTYTDCEKIVSQNDAFKSKTDIIDGFTITQYSYNFASFSTFNKPLASKNISAFELRGISFIHLGKNRFQRNIMMGKFFNLNETETTLYNNVKNKKIEFVQDKVDGSLIRFLKLPNGKVIAKSQYSFTSEQAQEAIKLYNTKQNLKDFIDYTLDNNLIALFEFTSPFNQIVLKYNEIDLKLLAIRRENGDYFHKAQLLDIAKRFNVNIAKFCENLTLEIYIEKAQKDEGIEGWVITFEDGQKIKLKTKWYLSLHRILTCTVNRENDLINSIVVGSIDDLLASIPIEDIESRTRITELTDLVIPHINETVKYIYDKVMIEYVGDKRTFAIANNKDRYFGLMMNLIKNPTEDFAKKLVCDYTIKCTHNLLNAKRFIEDIKTSGKLQI